MLGKLDISGATELLCYYATSSLPFLSPSLSPPSFSPPFFVPLPLSVSLSHTLALFLSHTHTHTHTYTHTLTHTHTHTHTALQPVLNFPSQFYDVRVSGDSVFEVKRTRFNCRFFFQKLSLKHISDAITDACDKVISGQID